MSAKKTSRVKAPKAKKAAETEATPTPEPVPAPEPSASSVKPAKTLKAKADPEPKKVSALDAAAKVLGEQGKPLNCQEMIDEMSRKKYWTSANGLAPHATLYAAILREIKVKGKDARFQKTERGKFASAER
jgi:HB1, ASXL, restriction endonuclease HTH domain